MDGSPQRKKARFSEHPQVFEYSEGGKKECQSDNDSLLIDMNDDNQTRQNQMFNIDQTPQLDNNAGRQLQIDEITSGLAQIEAYLQECDKPLEKYQQPQLTPKKNQKNYPQSNLKKNQRFSISIKPELKTGRETMSIQQQIKVRSIVKELPDQMSNNKKRMLNGQSKGKSIDERIEQELKKNKRVTMDAKQLMNIIRDYGDDEIAKKAKFDRKNRITMDVYALSKLIESAQQENQENKQSLTPIKAADKLVGRNKVFSAFKQNPHSLEIKFYIKQYLHEAPKRVKQKQNENRKLTDLITELKSELMKTELKISDAKKRIQKIQAETQKIEKHTKQSTQYLDSRHYIEDLQFIRNFQIQNTMQLLKCQITQDGCLAHVIFDDIFLKIKSKSKFGPTEIKLMVSREAKQNEKFFLLSIEDALKIIKKHHPKEQKGHFIESILKVRRAYERMQKLDSDLYYLSLVFKLKQFQFNQNLDKLSFLLFLYAEKSLFVQINLPMFLKSESSECVTLYDQKNSAYLKSEVEIKEGDNIIIEKITKLIDKCII